MSALRLELEVSAATPAAVRFLLRLRNTGSAPVALSFRSGRRFEITVADAAGAEIWRWSTGRRFTQAMYEETLAPGAAATYTAAWSGAPPGPYRAVAEMAAGDAPPASASFTVATAAAE